MRGHFLTRTVWLLLALVTLLLLVQAGDAITFAAVVVAWTGGILTDRAWVAHPPR